MTMTRHPPWLPFILLAFIGLALVYSVATPIFEASDEVSHYAVVQHIADSGELPVQQPGVKTAWDQEGSQPPLYYLAVLPVARLIDTSDARERMYRNPDAAPGDPSLDANRNLTIHSPAENFPWRNTTLAVHLIRFISIMMGAGTIALGYLIARRIFLPARPSVMNDAVRSSIPIGTAALIAFNPMFIFISASVNNDNLTILLTSLALYLSILCWYEPASRVNRAGWGRRLLLGIVLGGAALSKVSGLTVLPIAVLIMTVRHLRWRDWRGWFLACILIALPVLVIAGWWYVRNLQLYGELFGLNTMVAIAGPRALALADLIPEFDGFRYSYWALFGAVNIVTFPLAYVIFDLFTLVSAGGCAIWFVRNRRSERAALLAILASYVLIVFIGVVRWTMMTAASQGRLLFPAISAISLLLWLGWETMTNFGFWKLDFAKFRWTIPVFMFVTAIIVPFHDIVPTYSGPQMMSEGQLPADLKRLNVDYGDQLRLIGYRLDETPARPDATAFTLYWQCLKPMKTDYSIFAIVYGRQLQEVGKRDAYPYHGLYATSQCQPGQVFADPYRIPLVHNAQSPTLLRAQIGVKDQATAKELMPSANGTALPAVIVSVGKLASQENVAHDVRLDYQVGEHIRLLDANINRSGSGASLELRWQATGTPSEDYMTFVHILDANGKLIGQADGPPLNGDYPTTWWSPNEIITDKRPLSLPPEADQVTIGLYRLSNGTRLPITSANGQRVPNDEIGVRVRP